MKTIEIIVSPTGQTTVQTKGFSGSSCQEASRFLEQALGTRQSDERTAEFYQSESETQSVQQGTSP
ncbi:MAG TPA: DUF2997 domain-containing protein [Planctomycetaceae bacterium]